MKDLLQRRKNLLIKSLARAREIMHRDGVTDTEFAFNGGLICEVEQELEFLEELLQEIA